MSSEVTDVDRANAAVARAEVKHSEMVSDMRLLKSIIVKQYNALKQLQKEFDRATAIIADYERRLGIIHNV